MKIKASKDFVETLKILNLEDFDIEVKNKKEKIGQGGYTDKVHTKKVTIIDNSGLKIKFEYMYSQEEQLNQDYEREEMYGKKWETTNHNKKLTKIVTTLKELSFLNKQEKSSRKEKEYLKSIIKDEMLNKILTYIDFKLENSFLDRIINKKADESHNLRKKKDSLVNIKSDSIKTTTSTIHK